MYISEELVLQELLAGAKHEYVKKGTLLIETGEVQAQLPVLIKGVLRGFLLDVEGRDITDCFAFRPGDVAAGCNVLGDPSQISMEAVTDCQVLLLPMTVVQEEMEQNMEALRLYNRYLVEALQRHWEGKMLMHRFSAMQRYQWFLQTYTMDLGPDAFFPYEVQFTCGGETWTEWFMDPDDTVEVGGHTFSVETYVADPAALTGLSFEIGGRTVIAYPEEKEFTNDGPGIALWSLLPIKENRSLTLDMRGYLPDELKSVPVSAVLSGASTPITPEAGDFVVWAKGYRNDDYTIVGQDGTMDLAPENRYNSSYEMELIVGSRDQLDMSNIRNRLIVQVTPSDDLFDAVAYTNADPRQPITVYDSYLWERNSEQTILQLGVDPAAWTYGDLAYLSLGLDAAFNSAGLDAVVYQGLYDSQEAAVTAGAAVISDIWDQTGIATEGGHLADYGWKQNYRGMVEITVVLKRGDSVALVQPMILYMYEDEMNVSVQGLYVEEESRYNRVSNGTSYTWDNALDMQGVTTTLSSGYPADGTYYLQMSLYNPAVEYTVAHGIDYVRHAAVGNYSTAEQIQAKPDIKAQLFSDTGYPANYSASVVFSVLDTNGGVHRMKVVARASQSAELAPEPEPDSQDTYFRMNDASVASGESTRSLSAYVMPYEHDGYYYNGYSEFYKVFLDGRELVEGTDFVSESGSTKITIQAQTFQNAGGGTHVIAAEFRSDKNDTNTVKVTAQTYTVTIQGGGSGSGSSSGGSSGGATKPSVKPQQPDKTKPSTTQPGSAAATFQDVSSNNWFYSDVEWAYQNKLMIGVTKDLYKPYNPISPAMVVTVLSRMDKVDLSQYADTSYEEIEGGQWYTTAASWAKEAGLLPEGPFVGHPPMGRGQMAVMLVKYLKHAGIDCTLTGEPVVFADADLMTPEENEAFQVLYQFGIFKGIGNYTMDVAGATTRAQLAVLMHRVSVFVESHKK